MMGLAMQSLQQSKDLKVLTLSFLTSLPFAYFGTAILLIMAYLVQPALLSPMLLLMILRQAAPLGLVVIGQSVCMRVLSLDLSVGGVVVGVSYLLTSGIIGASEPVLLAISLLFGVFVGLVNAIFITRIRASSVIVTMATAMIIIGVVLALSQFHAPGEAPSLLKFLGQQRIGSVPVAVVVWIGLLIPVALFLRISVFGRFVVALGANPTAARVSGLPYVQIVMLTHVGSSLFAVLSGWLLVGFVGMGNVNLGADLALNSLTAVILGGVTFGAGRGGLLGPAIAAFLLTFSLNFLTSIGLGEPGKLMLQGTIIALAAIGYTSKRQM
jgi:ribose transport system permease protein